MSKNPFISKTIDEGNEEALRIARKFGNRLGMFLLLLKTGLPENRAIREDWDDEHWEYWANIETIFLVGGIANGRMCDYMLMVVNELFEKANVPMYHIVRNVNSSEIGAKGCLSQIVDADEVQILFDFGQTMMKRMIAVRGSDDEEYSLINLPSKKSINMDWYVEDDAERRRQAEELHRYIMESILETYKEALYYKGAKNAVCITAGTAFGVGFPEIILE